MDGGSRETRERGLKGGKEKRKKRGEERKGETETRKKR